MSKVQGQESRYQGGQLTKMHSIDKNILKQKTHFQGANLFSNCQTCLTISSSSIGINFISVRALQMSESHRQIHLGGGAKIGK